MSDKPKRSAEDIERDIRRTREDLTNSVNELAGPIDPKTNAKAAADAAKFKANEFGNKAKGVANDATAGDPTSIGIVAGAVATAALAIYLILKR